MKWIVTSAWPYVNAIPHLGNMIGSELSADVFARYLRMKGDEVVFVSGSDMHGTPSVVSAMKENIPVEQLCFRNHETIKKLFKRWKLSYDNYTQTHNPTHIKYCQDFYLTWQEHGYVFTEEQEVFYCPHDDLYLPDRFVEGTCPYCHKPGARGDQCDNPACGKLLTPLELVEPHCSICGNPPERRVTTHWYFDLPKLQDQLKEFIETNEIIPDNARTMCLNAIEKGLPARAITRDLKWGIPAPFEGAQDKVIYVWFEAVLGYISATIEWAEKIRNEPDKWKEFWFDADTRAVYFIGKDNIIFHLLLFPAFLLAVNEGAPSEQQYVLPYNVSSTEFLMYERDKFSKSRGVGIWIDDALELAPVDYWRYTLLRHRPETHDQSFLWNEFQKDINELNDIFGNFVHRVLTFLKRNFDDTIPVAGDFDEIDQKLLDRIAAAPGKVGALIEKFQLKGALAEIVELGRAGNGYLSEKAPWHLIKEDKVAAGHVLHVSIQVVHALAILLAPFVPISAKKIWKMLNIRSNVFQEDWSRAGTKAIEAGHRVGKAKPLFQKLDVAELQEKLGKIRKKAKRAKAKALARGPTREKPQITYKDFQKFQFRTATIKSARPVPDADRLLQLEIDAGEDTPRTLVAGIRHEYPPETLIGKRIVILANLEPKKIRGIMSNGMLLAVEDNDGNPLILTYPGDVAPGAPIL